jgi:hypothetical protein
MGDYRLWPIIVPAFLVLLIVARAVYLSYS